MAHMGKVMIHNMIDFLFYLIFSILAGSMLGVIASLFSSHKGRAALLMAYPILTFLFYLFLASKNITFERWPWSWPVAISTYGITLIYWCGRPTLKLKWMPAGILFDRKYANVFSAVGLLLFIIGMWSAFA